MAGVRPTLGVIAGVHEFPERTATRSALEIYLNLHPRHVDGTPIGGASSVAHVHHAAAAVAQGRCRVGLVTYGSTARSQRIPIGGGGRMAGDYADRFEAIHTTSTVGLYALLAQRHRHEYGTTGAQAAVVTVAARRHAARNPDAFHGTPITVDDVLASPMISSPLHRLDCRVITGGGGAVVVVHPDLAGALRKPPVAILGAAEAVAHTSAGRRDYLVSAAARTRPQALAEAGVGHADPDLLMVYDSFTITVLVTLEDLGFCRKGEGGPFVADGRLEPGEALPLNPDGGGLPRRCAALQYYPRGPCVACGATDLGWEPASGRGTVYTHTVTYRSEQPGFKERVPYVPAWVELEEGVQVLTNIVGWDPARVRIGLPVRVTFEDVTPEISIPRITPVE